MTAIVYIICHDEASEMKAKKLYENYTWARPLRMDDTIYMESWTHINHLEKHKDEWEKYDYVGTLTHSAFTKILIPHLDKMMPKLLDYDVIPFITTDVDLLTQMQMCHKGLYEIITSILKESDYSHYTINNNITFNPCNYWIIKKEYMTSYIKFIQNVYKISETNQEIKTKLMVEFNGYGGTHMGKNSVLKNKVSHISKERMKEKFGQDKYTFHCFMCERLPNIFFYNNNLKIYNYTQTILNFLNDDTYFAKKTFEKTQTHDIIKYIDYYDENNDNCDDDKFVYVVNKYCADRYPDIICNGNSTKLSFWNFIQ
jgi:hypothetical protein